MGLVFVAKTLFSAIIIASVSELAKRSTFWAALLISLPITSVLSFVWIYMESKDVVKIQKLSYEVLYLVIPSLLFFIALPFCLKHGLNFWISLVVSILATSAAYMISTKVFNLWD